MQVFLNYSAILSTLSKIDVVSVGSSSSFTRIGITERYLLIPVPAGISFPIMTFSLRPMRLSILPFTEASVKVLEVSWKEAADRKLSVERDAFVIPKSILLTVAGTPPS